MEVRRPIRSTALRRIVAALLLTGALAATPAAAAPRPHPTLVPGSRPTGAAAFLGPVRQVPVNGIRIGYRRFGRGPDLVLATGQTAPMSLWPLYLLRPLARHFRVSIFDHRGVGYSTDDPARRLSIPLMADDTAGLIRALGLSEATLVGWSMGGEIGLTLAERHPRALARLVTSGADAGGRHTIPPPAWVERGLASPDPAVAARTGLRLLFPGTPAGQAAQTRFVAGAGAGLVAPGPGTPGVLARQARAEAAFLRNERVWDGLGRIRIPVLVTNGRHDPGVPYGNAVRLARRIPDARRSIYRGAAHGMLFQDAARFAAQVTRFAREREREAPRDRR
jgi:pimeloyl-ACP methyl ester carboxylesterase